MRERYTHTLIYAVKNVSCIAKETLLQWYNNNKNNKITIYNTANCVKVENLKFNFSHFLHSFSKSMIPSTVKRGLTEEPTTKLE